MSAYAKVLILLLVVSVSAAGGWIANGWRLGSRIAVERQEWAQSQADANRQALKLQQERDDARAAKATAISTIDTAGTGRLKDLENETARLRRCIAAGTCGVRTVPARCPTADSGAVPGAATGAGVDSGAGAQPVADAGPAFLDARASIGRTEIKLAACQQALRAR